MSTAKIKEALLMLRVQAPPGTILEKEVDDAEAELEAIEKAARDISAYLSHGQPERYCLALALFDRIATSAK